MKHSPTLLRVIATLDAHSLVLHPGDRPYVVTSSGQFELTTEALTMRALRTLIAEVLPSDQYAALHRSGAVRYDVPPSAGLPRGRFSIVAARFDDGLWMEIRRQTEGRQDRHERRADPFEESNLTLPSVYELWGRSVASPTYH